MLIPIVTTTLGVGTDLWLKISSGLSSGLYERVGGVIRNARTKEVVTWLRSASDNLDPVQSGSAALALLPQLNAAISTMNLSITAIGFAVVMQRLNAVERRLTSVAKNLELVGRKMDLAFCANFRAAVDLGRTAFAMTDEGNRKVAATQAINRFLETQHHYLNLIDLEFNEGGWAVSPLISTYLLAAVTAARCYLELGELETARRHIHESADALEPRVKRFYDTVIAVNPAIFLHPGLSADVPLERLTSLMGQASPGATSVQVFDSLRRGLWETASRPAEPWLKRLPLALWNHAIDGETKFGPVRRARSNEDLFGRLLPRLADFFTQVEQAHEGLRCIRCFETELAFLMANNISYSDWQQLPAPAASDPIFLVIPNDSELVTPATMSCAPSSRR